MKVTVLRVVSPAQAREQREELRQVAMSVAQKAAEAPLAEQSLRSVSKTG